MLRNKDRQLMHKARAQSERLAFSGGDTDRAARQLQIAGQDFTQWVDDLTDEQLIEKIPIINERLDYVCSLAVEEQKDSAEFIGRIWDIRITLGKLATRAKNRHNQKEDGEC